MCPALFHLKSFFIKNKKDIRMFVIFPPSFTHFRDGKGHMELNNHDFMNRLTYIGKRNSWNSLVTTLHQNNKIAQVLDY